MMAVLDAINHGGKLSAVPAAETGAEDCRHLVGCRAATGRVRSCARTACGSESWRLKMKLRQYSICAMA